MFDFIYSVSNPYLVVMVVLIITGTGLPIPEEVPIAAAGVLCYHERMDVPLALLSLLVGALLGDCIMYAIGYHFGRSVVREHRWFARFLTPQREARIEHMLQVHGVKVFFLARFLVGLRSPVFLTSGILRVPFRKFILVDTLCASIVIGVFFGLSYTFAPHIKMAWQWIRGFEYTLTALVIVTVAGGIYWYLRKRRLRWHRVLARRQRRRDRAANLEAEQADANCKSAISGEATSSQTSGEGRPIDGQEMSDKGRPDNVKNGKGAATGGASSGEAAADAKRTSLGGNVAAADLHNANDAPSNPSHAALD
ncbi:MAG: DedA family protein [Planctomycetales bacterium]|nr:DedA family protein [Planctomycetales bacterium]